MGGREGVKGDGEREIESERRGGEKEKGKEADVCGRRRDSTSLNKDNFILASWLFSLFFNFFYRFKQICP